MLIMLIKLFFQTEMQVRPKPMLEVRQQPRRTRRRRLRNAVSEESSDEEDNIGRFNIALQPMAQPHATASCDDNDDVSEDEEDAPVLRRSTRTTASQHSNRHHLPRSSLQH